MIVRLKSLAAAAFVAPLLVAAPAVAGSGTVPILWPAGEGGNDHYYQLVADAVTAAGAKAAAKDATRPAPGYGPGYLVTITSSAEQDFITETFPPLPTCEPFLSPCIWIAASDEQNEGTFRWTDGPEEGMAFWPSGGYSNWYSGEPNDNLGTEDCAIYGWNHTSQWNDVGCQGTSFYVVEWDPARPCADPVALRVDPDGEQDSVQFEPRAVAASDALYILRAAVSDSECVLCTCDIDDSGKTTANDALLTLRYAVGHEVNLNCPACE